MRSSLELDDVATQSGARLDAHLTHSLSTNWGPADSGTKPSPPSTGGMTTTNPIPPVSG